MDSDNLPVVVVGAGAAGLMATIAAAQAGARVVLLEGTPDGGRKILISGGGRCNVLPSALAPGRFVTDSSPHTLRRMLLSFPLEHQRDFFERDLNIPLALEEETGKLFPASNRARDVRDGLVNHARRQGAQVSFGSRIANLERVPAGWQLDTARNGPITARAVVLATGGLSVPNTGSDGVGLDLVRALGHTVISPYPALTPLTGNSAFHQELAGVSLHCSLSAPTGDFQTTGGFLFTHRGYSGPAVLDISHLAARARLRGEPLPRLTVNWCAVDQEEWNVMLQQRTAATVGSVVRRQLPTRLAEGILTEAGLEPALPISQLPREARLRLVDRLVRYELPWTGDEGYKKAEVTGGGVALSEVHPTTLESRRCPGLFLCGEMLDAFGPIGGHNFAWAWSTGRAAGIAAARA
ncbi:MAG TPA: aminoacetone oxidase family FAD-binding enzyme [Gemmatimonadales bacterium]|nr:aminoacetone oxidase family FAD-binding enzyme [Gemmatimonadales bacterium]